MPLEKNTPLFNDENFPTDVSKNVLQKTLKIVNKAYKDTYTIGINIQGEYLKRFGFEFGDKVDVLISENQIKIVKIIDEKGSD